jgi:hypothetical protein
VTSTSHRAALGSGEIHVDEAPQKKGFSPSFSGFILQIFIPPSVTVP